MTSVLEVLGDQAMGVPVTKTVELLMQIMGIESDTIKRLARIEGKIDRLLDTPYNAAMEHVKSASLPGLSDNERERRLDLARDRLIDAIGAAGSDFVNLAAAQVALATLQYLRGQYAEAKYYATEACRASASAAELARADRFDTKMGRFQTGINSLSSSIENSKRWNRFALTEFVGEWVVLASGITDESRKKKASRYYRLNERSKEVREIAKRLGVHDNEIPK